MLKIYIYDAPTIQVLWFRHWMQGLEGRLHH